MVALGTASFFQFLALAYRFQVPQHAALCAIRSLVSSLPLLTSYGNFLVAFSPVQSGKAEISLVTRLPAKNVVRKATSVLIDW